MPGVQHGSAPAPLDDAQRCRARELATLLMVITSLIEYALQSCPSASSPLRPRASACGACGLPSRAFMSSLIRVLAASNLPFRHILPPLASLKWSSPIASSSLAMPVHCRRHHFWALVPDATPHLRCSTFSIPANYRSRETDRFRSAVLNW